jgi:hypothetical protein
VASKDVPPRLWRSCLCRFSLQSVWSFKFQNKEGKADAQRNIQSLFDCVPLDAGLRNEMERWLCKGVLHHSMPRHRVLELLKLGSNSELQLSARLKSRRNRCIGFRIVLVSAPVRAGINVVSMFSSYSPLLTTQGGVNVAQQPLDDASKPCEEACLWVHMRFWSLCGARN